MISEAERNGGLLRKLLPHMERMTRDRFGELWLTNAAANLPLVEKTGQSIAALHQAPIGAGDSAVIIAAGPSVKRKDPARVIRESGYDGALVVTESAMSYCLRNGVVPDLVVTLDPHVERVVRWFGDPTLTIEKLAEDDYFARQDQDDAFADEMRANDEMLSLLDKHGKDMKIALSMSSSQPVVQRAIDSGMDVYWWLPMLDDPDLPDSVTADLQGKTGLPAFNTGGNVGTACWMMADALLEKQHIALTGVDFSYYDGTPYLNTQYYYELVRLVGEDALDSLFVRIHNPYENAWFFTDPAYMWYRECFLELIEDAQGKTYNCTEGGILFGDGITVMPLREFLSKVGA